MPVPAAGKRARVQTLYRTDKLEPLGEALAVLQFARSQVGGACGQPPGGRVQGAVASRLGRRWR